MRHRRARRARPALLVVLGAILLGAVGVGIWQWRAHAAPRPVARRHRPPPAEVAAWSNVATLRAPAPGYASPSTAGAPTTVPVPWASQFLAMPVVASVPGWVEVRVVASPPAPALEWIASSGVVLTRSPYHVVVDLGITRLLLFDRSRLVMCAPAGVGTATSPTPLGSYFVGLLIAAPPTDAGPFAIITSASSDSVTDWEQSGHAMITIAASPDAPRALGATGSMRTTGSVEVSVAAEAVLRAVPLGSPVDVLRTLSHPLSPSAEQLCDSSTGIPARHRPHRHHVSG